MRSDCCDSTWRPLNAVLEDNPLALCDSRTVLTDDLVAADRILPDRVGEVYYLHYNPNQEWSVLGFDIFFSTY